jgi:hypothetical protein
MSVYQVNKLLYMTDNDPAFRKRMKEAPDAALDEFRLTPEEREALTSGAVGRLYQMGVHTFLLNHLSRYELFGVNRENYLERIRVGMDYDPRFEQGKMPMQYFIKERS